MVGAGLGVMSMPPACSRIEMLIVPETVPVCSARGVSGVVLPVALGLMSLRSGLAQPGLGNWQTLLGAWLVTIAANYVPLFLYALAIVRGGTVQQEGLPELKHVRRYRIQQAMILVPFLVAAVAFAQERRHRQQQPE